MRGRFHVAQIMQTNRELEKRADLNKFGTGVHPVYAYGVEGDEATPHLYQMLYSVDEFTPEEAQANLATLGYTAIDFKPAPDMTEYIILKPKPEQVAELAMAEGIPVDDLHITVFYPDQDDTDTQDIAEAVSRASRWTSPVQGVFNGTARFMGTEGEPDSFVALFDSQDILELHRWFDGRLMKDGTHGFIPHMTLIKLDGSEEPMFTRIDPVEVELGKLVLVQDMGEEKNEITFHLQSSVMTMPPNFHESTGYIGCGSCLFFDNDFCRAYAVNTDRSYVCDDYDEIASPVEGKSVQSVQGMPWADRQHPWDRGAAVERVRKWAGGPNKDDIDWTKYRKAFLIYDEEKPNQLTSYKMPIADVVDGTLKIVPKAVFQAANSIQGGRDRPAVSGADLKDLKTVVGSYYTRMSKQFEDKKIQAPWLKEQKAANEEDEMRLVDLSKAINGLPPTEGEAPANTDPTADSDNCLKAVSYSPQHIRVANHIAIWGGKDLEGTMSPRKNADGSAGEYFDPTTDFKSIFTEDIGKLAVDWEHRAGRKKDAGAGPADDVLGYVDWSTAKATDTGLWVERVLDRRNKYVQILDQLGWFEGGVLGSSSEPIKERVEKADDGRILKWPLRCDTLTVNPMEPRMMSSNQLEMVKALGLKLDNENSTTEEEVAEQALVMARRLSLKRQL